MSRPFAGVRILDFTRYPAGPYGTFQLALPGADVVKIESRDGDETRQQLVAGAASSTRSASSSVVACDSVSNGRPAELPSGKSLKRKRGTPQCSTMSFAHPMITVGRPLASRCRATRLTVW